MKKPIFASVLSAVIWGSGQLYNKQYLKGILFLAIQVILISVELLTGDYFSGSFHFREAGFFVSGFWGMITLGTQLSELTMDGITEGDHSIMLLLQGIIAVMVAMVFVVIWVINIKDAYKTSKIFNETKQVISSKEWLLETWEKSFEYLVLIPAAIMLMLFVFMPIIFSFAVAFTNYNADNMPPANLISWVGFQNFRFLFSMGENVSGGNVWLHTFVNVSKWTLIFAVIATIVPFFLGLLQAVAINHKEVKYKKLWRSIFILPWAMPALISLLNFQQIFNGQFGPLNRFLMNHGIISNPILWLSDSQNPWLPRMTILVIQFWLAFPYFMALMSGVMTSISKDIYEASEIDGANERQQFWRITLPLVISATAPLLVMSFASNFNNFGIIYFLTGGGPTNPNFIYAGQTDILISWIFNLTLNHRMYNMASVMSVFIFLVIGSISAYNFTKTRAFKEEL